MPITLDNPSPEPNSKGAQRIKDLTRIAAELFLERGFEAVAVDDLIAKAGGSRRNIYSHFGGKDGLFVEAIQQLCAELSEPITQLVIDSEDFRHGLETFGHALLRAVLAPRTLELHRLMIAEGKRFPELAQTIYFKGHMQSAEVLSRWIAGRQAAGLDLSCTHLLPLNLARQFVSLLVAEPQLRALTGIMAVPIPEAEARNIVSMAVDVFLKGTSIPRAI